MRFRRWLAATAALAGAGFALAQSGTGSDSTRQQGSQGQSGQQQSGTYGRQSGTYGQQSGTYGQQSGTYGQQSGTYGQTSQYGQSSQQRQYGEYGSQGSQGQSGQQRQYGQSGQHGQYDPTNQQRQYGGYGQRSDTWGGRSAGYSDYGREPFDDESTYSYDRSRGMMRRGDEQGGGDSGQWRRGQPYSGARYPYDDTSGRYTGYGTDQTYRERGSFDRDEYQARFQDRDQPRQQQDWRSDRYGGMRYDSYRDSGDDFDDRYDGRRSYWRGDYGDSGRMRSTRWYDDARYRDDDTRRFETDRNREYRNEYSAPAHNDGPGRIPSYRSDRDNRRGYGDQSPWGRGSEADTDSGWSHRRSGYRQDSGYDTGRYSGYRPGTSDYDTGRYQGRSTYSSDGRSGSERSGSGRDSDSSTWRRYDSDYDDRWESDDYDDDYRGSYSSFRQQDWDDRDRWDDDNWNERQWRDRNLGDTNRSNWGTSGRGGGSGGGRSWDND